jgi:hypothetical protein
MAFGKTAGCLIMAGAAIASAAQFPMRHEHFREHCEGVLTMDEGGVSFAGPKKHAWTWQYRDIKQLTLSAGSVSVLTYKDKRLQFTGQVPAQELYALLHDRLDQRFIAALAQETSLPAWTFPVKHHRGSEGSLTFGADSVVYDTAAKGQSRTWRYRDIDNISSSGPFELTVTTFERELLSDRRGFHFDLKERLPESTYNEIWMQVQKKNGKIN